MTRKVVQKFFLDGLAHDIQVSNEIDAAETFT